MSVLAVAIKHLVALGMTGDALASAIAEMEAAQDNRSTGAKRQQRYRDRLAERNEASQTVTRDDGVTPPPSLDKETSPRPPKEIKPIPRVIDPREADPVQVIADGWNDMASRTGLARIAKLTTERRRRIQARLAEHSQADFTEAIAAVERSSFCRGDNGKGWRADFDFILQPQSFNRLIEGSYDRSNSSTGSPANRQPRGAGLDGFGAALREMSGATPPHH